jgi:glycosyltransferase involved in cell wall biosynthesis
VSAVIVTRGNTDLTPVLESLTQFDEVIVWDNSAEQDAMTYGRVLALDRCRNNVVWSQDDDIVHTPDNQRRILAEYRPGVLTGCMWDEWSDGALRQGIEGGYSDLVFPGSGSVYDKHVAVAATSRYLTEWPLDDFFRLWCDTIVGILAPNRQLDIQFEALPEAEDDYRMCYLPNAVELKTEAIRRARKIRDRKPSWRDVRVHAAAERVA